MKTDGQYPLFRGRRPGHPAGQRDNGLQPAGRRLRCQEERGARHGPARRLGHRPAALRQKGLLAADRAGLRRYPGGLRDDGGGALSASLHKGSTVIVNTQRILPPAVATGQTAYPEKILDHLTALGDHGGAGRRLRPRPGGGRGADGQRGHGRGPVGLSAGCGGDLRRGHRRPGAREIPRGKPESVRRPAERPVYAGRCELR